MDKSAYKNSPHCEVHPNFVSWCANCVTTRDLEQEVKRKLQPNPDGLIDVTPLRPRCISCHESLTPVGKYHACMNDKPVAQTVMWRQDEIELGEAPMTSMHCPRYGLLTVVSEKP